MLNPEIFQWTTSRPTLAQKAKIVVLVLAAVYAVGSGNALSADVQPERQDVGWPSYGNTSDEQRFSPLTQISASNIHKLGLTWSLVLEKRARALEATPLEVDGVLYFTTSMSIVYAVDAATGSVIWQFDPEIWKHEYGVIHGVNRGVAYADGRVFVASTDGRLIALNSKTGKILWITATIEEKNTRRSSTGAPRAFNGKVFIGNGGGDWGMRGYVSAYDAVTGTMAWRFYTVPGNPADGFEDEAMEMAAKTWSGEWWRWGGGGTVWNAIVFDPELNRIYIGTSNSAPYNPRIRNPAGRDNLFLASIVALDADTGKYIWHYQVNPNEAWDWKATDDIVQAELMIEGSPRKVLMQAPTNGFFYVIDRLTGKLISAEKIAKATWAKRIDIPTGRPVEMPGIRYENGPITFWPHPLGTHNWRSMAFSPRTGLAYIPNMQLGARYEATQEEIAAADSQTVDKVAFGAIGAHYSLLAGYPNEGTGELLAWDPVRQKARWRVKYPYGWNGGVVVTANNLAFHGTADGWFYAYDALTGRRLWRYYAGQGIMAAPITYTVGGKQYVTVLAGFGVYYASDPGWRYGEHLPRVLTFSLGGTAKLATRPPDFSHVPPIDDPSFVIDSSKAAAGRRLYGGACALCHAELATTPDLRGSGLASNLESFRSVVKDGALEARGMPRFRALTDSEVDNLFQYVRQSAREERLGVNAPAPSASTF